MSDVRWEQLYKDLLAQLKAEGQSITPGRGRAQEIIGFPFTLPDPRDRCILSEARGFNVFQAMGHWLWIMDGRADLPSIEYYNPRAQAFSSDLRKLDGAYGPRIFGQGVYDQIPRVIELLRKRPDSRRAVATVYRPDLDSYRTPVEGREDEVPCTVALQYFRREGKLHAVTTMRSQDAFGVLPYDLFIFTLLQEYVAVSIGAELGMYRHFSGSFHYYIEHEGRIDQVMKEKTISAPLMPPMPEGSQKEYLDKVLQLEERIRVAALYHQELPKRTEFNARDYIEAADNLPDFWRAAAHCLIASAAITLSHDKTLRRLHDLMDPPLDMYVERALSRMAPSLDTFVKSAGANNPQRREAA